MTELEIRLFGTFTVQIIGDTPIHFATRKEQELLAYLLLHSGRPLSREVVASLLWSETSTAQSKMYLRKALYRLRSTLKKAGASGVCDSLQSDTDWLQMDLPDGVLVDVIAFEEGLTHARQAETNASMKRALLEQTAAYYVGELLEGWYHEWCLYKREHFHQRFVGALYQLIRSCEESDEPADAVAHGLRLVKHAPYSERAHRMLMRAHYLAGDRHGALQQYQQCRRMTLEELGVAPAGKTEALKDKIQAGAAVTQIAPASAAIRHHSPSGSAELPLDLLIRQLEQTLHILRMLAEDLERHENA